MPLQGRLLKTLTYLGLSLLRAYLGLLLKPMAQNYLFFKLLNEITYKF